MPELSALPYVDLVVSCAFCGFEVITDTGHFVKEALPLPLSVDQAQEYAGTMHGWCHHGEPMLLTGLTIYAPGDESDDPLLEWGDSDLA